MLSTNKYSLLKPNYTKERDFKRTGILKSDEYKGHKLTKSLYNYLPIGSSIYEDKFNSDTYKLLNNGKDDRKWSDRHFNKLTSGKILTGGLGIAGGVLASTVAAPIAVPIALTAAGAGLIGHSVVNHFKKGVKFDKDIQRKMIDLREKTKNQSNSEYKGYKLSSYRLPQFRYNTLGLKSRVDSDDKKLAGIVMGSLGGMGVGMAVAPPVAAYSGLIGRFASRAKMSRDNKKTQMDIIDMLEKTKKHAKWNPFSDRTAKVVKGAGKLAGATAFGATAAAAGEGALNNMRWLDTAKGIEKVNKYKELIDKGHFVTTHTILDNGITGPNVNVNMLGPKAALIASGAGATLAANAPWLVPTLAGAAAVGGGVALYKHLKKKHDENAIKRGTKLPEGQYFFNSKIKKQSDMIYPIITKKQSLVAFVPGAVGAGIGALRSRYKAQKAGLSQEDINALTARGALKGAAIGQVGTNLALGTVGGGTIGGVAGGAKGALLGSGLGAATSLINPGSMIGIGSGVASRFVGNDAKERLKQVKDRS